MKRQLLTEQDVRTAAQQGKTRLAVPRSVIVTPLAADLAYEKKMTIERTDTIQVIPSVATGTSVSADLPSVVIGSDHGGFGMKAELIQYLGSLGVRVEDVGTVNTDPCDYPDFAHAVAVRVAGGGAALGIMIDSAGVGSCTRRYGSALRAVR